MCLEVGCAAGFGPRRGTVGLGWLISIVALAAAVGPGTASAQTIRTWNDAGGNVNWSRTQNWTGGVLPGTNEIAALGSAFQGGSINLQSTSRTVFGINIIQSGVNTSWTLAGASTATGVSLVSGSLTRFSNVTGTQTFAQPVTLGTNTAAATTAIWTIDGGDRLVISSTISAVNAGTTLTKTGTGILELSGANTFGGAFTINQGTVSIATINNGGVAGVTGTSSSAAANFVLGGGTLEYTGVSGTTNRSFTLTNSTTSTFNVTTAATNLQFTGSTAATTGALTKTGAGTLTLAGVGGYTGATTVNAGTLALGVNNALAAGTPVTINGAAFNVGGFSDTIASLTTSGNTTLAFTGSAATAGSLSLGALTLGAGTDTLTVNFTTAPTLARYNLIGYTSRSGTFDSTSITGATGYRLVYGSTGSGTVALAQLANQTFTATSGTTRGLVGSAVTVTGTLANTANSGAAELTVSLAGAGFGGFSSSAGSLVAGAATSIITGTLTAPATPGTQAWTMVNTDSLATTTSATASAVLQAVIDRTYSPTAIALGRFLGTVVPTGTSTITSTGLSGTTASGTIGSFTNSVANGLTLSLATGTNVFSGATATQSPTYTTGGSFTGGFGAISGTFNATATNEFGGTSTVPVTYTGTAVAQRSFTVTSSTVALGRYLITNALPTGTTGLTSTGLNATTANASLDSFGTSNGLTLSLTSGSANFLGAATPQTAGYTVSGTATSAGLLSGSFSSTVTAEFGSISPVVVNYTANPVNQRTFTVTTSTVALGRYLITGATPAGTTDVTSTGLNATTASGTLGTFSSSNGFTLSLAGGSTDFSGATNSQTANYAVGGSATSVGLLGGSFSSTVGTEFGSISPVVVNYTANPVNQRLFTTSTSTLALGFVHQGASLGSAALVVTSTGLNATTANATLGSFSGGPSGLSLGLTSGSSQFNGAAASQSATYTLSGTATGVITGTFTSTVSAELGSIPSVSVAVSGEVYSGQSIWATNGGGDWGTLAGTGPGAFGINWQAGNGSPGLDPSFATTDTALFGSALTSGSAAVYLAGANPSLKSITFNNTNGYSIFASSGGSRIILSSTGAAQLNTLSGTHAIHSELLLESNSVFNIATSAMFEMHGTLSGSGSLRKTGGGILEFYGNNDFVGNTSIEGGLVFIESGTAPFGVASNLVSITGGAILDLNGKNVINTMTILGSGTILNAFNPLYVTNISGTGVVTSGTGTEILGTYGVLSGGFGTFVGPMAATATVNGGGRATFANSLVGGADVTVDTSAIALFSGTQGGNVTTSGSSTFDGDVTETVDVLGGYSAFNAATTLGSTVNVNGGFAAFAGSVGGIAHVTSASGTATYAGLIASTASIEFTNGGVGRLLDGASVAVASMLNNGSIFVDRSVNLLLPSIISGTGSFTKLGGSSAVIMTAANTYTGPTTISSGTVQLGNGGTAGSLSSSSPITNDGTLVFNRSNTVTQGVDFSSAPIGGSGGVVQAGGGVVVLNAINTYTGPTSILSGTLSAAEIVASQNGSNIGKANTAVVLGNQGTLLYTGSTKTYSRGFDLTAGGGGLVVQSPSTTLTMNNQSPVTGIGDFTVGGSGNVLVESALSQTGDLRYNGTGVLTLNEDNSYTGMTYVDSGKLIVNDGSGSKGSIASSATVASAAVLGGVGTISGTISGSGLVSPGNSPGILEAVALDPSLSITSAFEFTVKNAEPNWSTNNSSQNDVLRLTGGTPFLSPLTSANVVDVYFNVPGTQLPLVINDYVEGGFYSDTLTAAQLYEQVRYGNFVAWMSTTGTGERTFNGVNYNPLSYTPGLTGVFVRTVDRSANFGGGTINGSVTQFVLVPEPGTMFAGVFGVGLIGVYCRMFRRRKVLRNVACGLVALILCLRVAGDVAYAGGDPLVQPSAPASAPFGFIR